MSRHLSGLCIGGAVSFGHNSGFCFKKKDPFCVCADNQKEGLNELPFCGIISNARTLIVVLVYPFSKHILSTIIAPKRHASGVARSGLSACRPDARVCVCVCVWRPLRKAIARAITSSRAGFTVRFTGCRSGIIL